MAIESTTGKWTDAIIAGLKPKRFPPDLIRAAERKIAMVDAAKELDDLKSPPGNMLEPLKGDRKGQHSIRINLKWRVCFVWKNGGAYDVEICDYHP